MADTTLNPADWILPGVLGSLDAVPEEIRGKMTVTKLRALLRLCVATNGETGQPPADYRPIQDAGRLLALSRGREPLVRNVVGEDGQLVGFRLTDDGQAFAGAVRDFFKAALP